MNIENYYDVALNLVKQSGKYIRDKINTPKNVSVKTCDVDLVTECDEYVEKFLIEGISKNFADHKFIGEEATSSGQKVNLTNDPTWIIDPIDGTMNFVHTFPHTCISIALMINKDTKIGIVYNPILEQLFTAKKDNGAFLNGQRIKTSGQKDLKKAIMMMEMGTSRNEEKMQVVMENIKTLMPKVHGIRTLGSAALNICMVALGGADANFEYGPHIWDFAAGDLIVREAGGVSMDPAGGSLDLLNRRYLCASTKELAEEISNLLVQYYPGRD